MTEAGFGRVVVIASVAGKVGSARIAAYTASKHGVLGLVRTAAAEVARTGVTVNAVCPGYVDTPMTDESVATIAAGTGRSAEEARAILENMQPIGRLVTVEEVASAMHAVRRQRGDQRARSQHRRRSRFRADGKPAADQPDRRWPKPSGFSHAVIARGTTIHLAGQTGMDSSGAIVAGGVVPQFEQALANLITALNEAGGYADGLASLTIYIVDMDDYRAHAREIGEVWKRLVGTDYPAMAGIGVTRLWDAEAVVEIQGYAVSVGASDLGHEPGRLTARHDQGVCVLRRPARGAGRRGSAKRSAGARTPGQSSGSRSSGMPGSR